MFPPLDSQHSVLYKYMKEVLGYISIQQLGVWGCVVQYLQYKE